MSLADLFGAVSALFSAPFCPGKLYMYVLHRLSLLACAFVVRIFVR